MSTQLHLESWMNNQKWCMLVARIQASIGFKLEPLTRKLEKKNILYYLPLAKS
jgi:hypothetical protein